MGRSCHDNSGDGVLEDQLFLIVGFEHDGVLIERPDTPSQFNATEKVDRNNGLIFPRGVEE